MSAPGRFVFIAVIFAVLSTDIARGREWQWSHEPVISPDGSGQIVVHYGEGPKQMGTEWEIVLIKHGRVLHRRRLSEDLDIRYVKVSWSPSSRAVLIGEGYRGAMDLTLLRIGHRQISARHFAMDDRMSDKEENELPLHRELQSSNGASRVVWSTVKWRTTTRCTMVYAIWGFGYIGEGNVTIDFTGHAPRLKLSRLRPLTREEYLGQFQNYD